MNMQQWNMHETHMKEHIKWPATKEEIIAACKGEDVEADVLNELRTKLTDSGKKYTESELKKLIVM